MSQVPNHSSMTTEVSKWLHEQLWPICKKYDWVLDSSTTLIKKIDEYLVNPKEDSLLVSADVKSLYTNIRIDEALRKIKALLLQEKYELKQVNKWIDLLRWVLKNNYFTYQGQIYHQICGTAMGSNVAPAFATLYMIFHEKQLMRRFNIQGKEFPPLYNRYIDDSFMLLNKDTPQLKEIKNLFNEMSPDLEFNFDASKDKINILDIIVYKGKRFYNRHRLDYKMYEKPTNPHQYTSPDSYVPGQYKYPWITGEQIRMIRNSSDSKVYKEIELQFQEYLKLNGYDEYAINKYLKFSYDDRKTLLLDKNKRTIDTNKIIMLPHEIGWDILKHKFRLAVKGMQNTQYGELITKNPQVIVRQGKSLSYIINKTNKKTLHGMLPEAGPSHVESCTNQATRAQSLREQQITNSSRSEVT